MAQDIKTQVIEFIQLKNGIKLGKKMSGNSGNFLDQNTISGYVLIAKDSIGLRTDQIFP